MSGAQNLKQPVALSDVPRLTPQYPRPVAKSHLHPSPVMPVSVDQRNRQVDRTQTVPNRLCQVIFLQYPKWRTMILCGG